MNLDPFGDQSNKVWYTYTASKPMTIGEEFSLFMGMFFSLSYTPEVVDNR